MTLDQWMQCCEKAITANFRCRNVRVFECASRHGRIVRSRRAQVREWIDALRQARNPETAQLIAHSVRWKIA
jgi:hypothetical protein